MINNVLSDDVQKPENIDCIQSKRGMTISLIVQPAVFCKTIQATSCQKVQELECKGQLARRMRNLFQTATKQIEEAVAVAIAIASQLSDACEHNTTQFAPAAAVRPFVLFSLSGRLSNSEMYREIAYKMQTNNLLPMFSVCPNA